MERVLITMFDSKAGSWSPPVCLENKAVALRQFSDLVSDTRTLVGQHPGDFDLWIVGRFDVSSGHLESIVPEHVANGFDVKPKD